MTGTQKNNAIEYNLNELANRGKTQIDKRLKKGGNVGNNSRDIFNGGGNRSTEQCTKPVTPDYSGYKLPVLDIAKSVDKSPVNFLIQVSEKS